jgi:antitoxin component YwqK of YwqJK toxin-antitoxin module
MQRRFKWMAATAAVIAALGVVVWISRHSPQPGPGHSQVLPEVARTNLVLHSGRLCLPGGTNLFTGQMVEYAENGSLRSRSVVSNGLLNGLSAGYYTNAQMQVSETFKDGVSHGLRTKWYPDGVRKSEAMIVDGELHGLFRRWHENGVLAEEVQFVHGIPDGDSVAYFPSGNLKARVTLQTGKILTQNFYTDGPAAN